MGQFRKWLRALHENDRKYMKLGFGKYRGLDHTAADRGWLRWALQNTTQFTPEQRAELEAYLKTPKASLPARPTTQDTANQQNAEMLRQGYVFIQASQYDDRFGRYKAGEPIWRHPKTGKTYPAKIQASAAKASAKQPAPVPEQPQAAPTEQPAQPTQPQTPRTWWTCAYVKDANGQVTQQRAVLRRETPDEKKQRIERAGQGAPEDELWFYKTDPAGQEEDIPRNLLPQFFESVPDPKTTKKMVVDPTEWLTATTQPLIGAPSPAVEPLPAAQDPQYKGRPSPEQVRLPPEKLSPYNKAIEQKFLEGQGDIMIDALAGTGKTTQLKHLSSFIKPGEKWLYLVFNKKNQVESQMEFPPGVDVLTTHAFLGRLLKQQGKEVGGKTDLPPKGQKWKKIYQVADQLIPLNWPESMHSYYSKKSKEMVSPFHWKAKRLVTKIAEMAKAYALSPGAPTIEQDMHQLIAKCSFDMDLSTEKLNQDRDFTPDIIQMATELLKLTLPGGLPREIDQQFAMYRDQDDTLWYAAMFANQINWRVGYNVILMDEVQDFNMCQLIMAQKLREAGARVIAVGDPNQAMYLFRGADSAAFQKLKEVIGQGSAESLPINFRSGGNLINWITQNTHVQNLQAAPHLAGKGNVYAAGGTHPPMGYEDFMQSVVGEYQQGRRTSEPTAMICRTNAPLAHAALTLLKNNVDFQIVGKDMSQDLTDLIKRVTWNKPQNANLPWFSSTMASYVEDLESKWHNKISKQDELLELQAYADVLYAVLQHLESYDYREEENGPQLRTAQDLIGYLQRKLGGVDPDNLEEMSKLKAKDPRSFVTLTTAHKSKGLEWQRIFLMKPKDYDPNGPKIKNEEQAQQEKNSWYVASTRGRNTLMVSADEEP